MILIYTISHTAFGQIPQNGMIEYATNLAMNSSQFQSIVQGYNYTVIPLHSSNGNIIRIDFAVYDGNLARNTPAKIVGVLEDFDEKDYAKSKVIGFQEHSAHVDSYGMFIPTNLPSPLKQIQSGILPTNIHCNLGYLVIKDQSHNRYCVTPQTAQKLVTREWEIMPMKRSYNMDIQVIGSLNAWNNISNSSTFENITKQTLSNFPTIQMAMQPADGLYSMSSKIIRENNGNPGMAFEYVRFIFNTSINMDEAKQAFETFNFTKSIDSGNPNEYSARIQYNMTNYLIQIDSNPSFQSFEPWNEPISLSNTHYDNSTRYIP